MKFWVLASLILISITLADDDPRKVLIVYNTAFPDRNGDGIGDSQEAAEYYAAKRGVPATNIIGLPLTNSTYFSNWRQFYEQLVVPVRAKIDSLGERNIFYILLSYGIPERVNTPASPRSMRGVDNVLCLPSMLDSAGTVFPTYWYYNVAYFESSPTRGSDRGHFTGNERLLGNRLFLVTRLDGIDVEYAKGLVDMALYGEKYIYPDSGYYNGIGYVDTRYAHYSDSVLIRGYPFGYGSYARADSSMAFGKFFVVDAGFKLMWEYHETEIGESGAVFEDGTSAEYAPNALWYEGWYNYNKYQDAWEWIPGSAACDLNSNSGAHMRDSLARSFLTNAFKRGLTCGVGCVGEPYLSGHARPEVFLYYMLNGFNFAEASYLSQPALLWRAIHIGDPLYNPMKPKTPIIDTIPPPMPAITLTSRGDTAKIKLEIPTSADRPELMKAKIIYGRSLAALTDSTDWTPLWRTRQEIVITGLIPDSMYYFIVTMKDPVGNISTTAGDSFICGRDGLVGIASNEKLPKNMRLIAYPNPFNTAVRIKAPIGATISIYSINGRVVATFSRNEIIWHPETNSSGVYIVAAKKGKTVKRIKIMHIK